MSRQDITILKKKLKKARENGKLRDVYEYSCSLAACLTDVEEYEEALSLYREGLEASEILNYNEGIILANRMIAETCMSLGNFDEALKHVNIFLKCAQDDNNKVEEQRGLVLKGHVFFTHAEYLTDAKPEETEKIADLLNKSMEAYRKSFAICISDLSGINEKERLQMKARLLQNKSLVLIRQNKLDQAQNHLIRAVKICAKEKLKDTECMCYLSLGDLYLRKGEYENAFNVFEKASELSTTTQRKIDAAVAKARACILLENLEKAKIILKKSYKLKPNDEVKKLLKYIVTLIKLENSLCTVPTSDLKCRIQIYKKLGGTYCTLNCLKKGIKCYLNMLEYCQKSETFEVDLIKCYQLLFKALQKDKQYDKALFYCNQEVALLGREPEKACKTYFRMAKLHELNNSDFDEIYYAYMLAKSKAIELNLLKMKIKCLNQIIRIAKKAEKVEIVENAMKELQESKVAESDSSCDSGSDYESDETDSNESGKLTSDSDIDIQSVLQESDIENEEVNFQPIKRSRRSKFSLKRNEKGETALHVAAIKGNYRKVKALLDQGHPVNVRDTAGWTPLHEACNHGYVDIVKILLDYGADINDKGGPCCDGTTPLHDAAINGQMEVINILVKRGASVLVLNKFGETPLQCLMKWKKSSALDGEEEEMLKTLIKVLKSPLDSNNLKSIPFNAENSTEKVPESKVWKVRNKVNSPTYNSRPFDKFEKIKNKRGHGKRQALCSSDEEQSSDGSDTSSSGACSMYRNVIKNLRHRPKKFKTSQYSENESKKALIDAENYVDNCIMDNDDDEDDERDVTGINREDEDDHYFASSCGFVKKGKKERSKVDEIQVVSQGPPQKTDFSDLEEDCLDQLMKELEELPSGVTSTRLCDGEVGPSEPSESTWSLNKNKYNHEKHLVQSEVPNGDHNKSDSQKDASMNSSGDSGLSCSKTIEAVSDTCDIRIKVCNNDMKLSVKTVDMHKLNIDWLIREVAKKYPIVESNDYFLSLKTTTKPSLSESDSLTTLANEIIEITATKWKSFPLSERYEKVCSKRNHFDVAPETRYHGFRYTILSQVRDMLKASSSTRCFAFSNLKLSPLTLIPICKTLKYESFVQILNFSNNYFGDKGLESIVKVLETCIVEELDLSGCNITSSGVYHLSDSLNAINELSRNGLQVLNLSKNPITDDAVEAIYSVLEKLPNLSVLNIEGCELETKIRVKETATFVILQGSNVAKT